MIKIPKTKRQNQSGLPIIILTNIGPYIQDINLLDHSGRTRDRCWIRWEKEHKFELNLVIIIRKQIKFSRRNSALCGGIAGIWKIAAWEAGGEHYRASWTPGMPQDESWRNILSRNKGGSAGELQSARFM